MTISSVQSSVQHECVETRPRKRLCQTVTSHAIAAFEAWFESDGQRVSGRAIPRLLCSQPRVWCIDNFLTESETRKVLECVQRLEFASSKVGDGKQQRVESYKSSSSAAFTYSQGNLSVLSHLHQRIEQLMPGVALEKPLQVVKYEPGQSCALHHDSASLDVSGRSPKVVPTDEKVVRVMTGFLYLTTLSDGATAFPRLGISVLPRAGRLVLFPDVVDIRTLELDERTIHAAEPTKGVKYGINIWFLNKYF